MAQGCLGSKARAGQRSLEGLLKKSSICQEGVVLQCMLGPGLESHAYKTELPSSPLKKMKPAHE